MGRRSCDEMGQTRVELGGNGSGELFKVCVDYDRYL